MSARSLVCLVLTMMLAPWSQPACGKPPDLPVDPKVACKPDAATQPESQPGVAVEIEIGPKQISVRHPSADGASTQNHCLYLDAVSPCLWNMAVQLLGGAYATDPEANADSRPVNRGTDTGRRDPDAEALREIFGKAYLILINRTERQASDRSGDVVQAQGFTSTQEGPAGAAQPQRPAETRFTPPATPSTADDGQDRGSQSQSVERRQGETPAEDGEQSQEEELEDDPAEGGGADDPGYWLRHSRPLGLYREWVAAPEASTDDSTRQTQAKHLYLIGLRCLRLGDEDMARSCFQEAGCLAPRCRYGAQAQEQLQTLDSSRTEVILQVENREDSARTANQGQAAIPTLFVEPQPERLIIREDR